MREWHRDLAEIARIEAARRRAEAAQQRGPAVGAGASGNWRGAAIADWSWSQAAKDRSRREDYLVIQLRTAADLVAETRAMHHCVASYAPKCIAGQASIWSLRRRAEGAFEQGSGRSRFECLGRRENDEAATLLEALKRGASLDGP
jgi:hypothetical protein